MQDNMAALSKFSILYFLVAGLLGSRLLSVKCQGAVLKRWNVLCLSGGLGEVYLLCL